MKRASWYAYVVWIPVLFAGSAVAQQYVLRLHPNGDALSGLAQVLPVATHWGRFGVLVCLPLLATIAIACVPYAFAVRKAMVQALERHVLLVVLLTGCATIVAGWCWHVVYSSDVYAYATYGDLAAHGIDPYVRRVIVQPDAIVTAAAYHWGNPPPGSVYGPLFVAIAATIVRIAHGSVAASLWGLRVLELFAYVASVIAYAAALRAWHHPRQCAALVAFALNPLILWTIAEGHNDVTAFAFVAAAFAVAIRAPLAAGFLVAASVAVKATGIVAVLGAVPLLFRSGGARLSRFAAGTMAGLVAGGIAFALFLRIPPPSSQTAPVHASQVAGGTVAWIASLVLHHVAHVQRVPAAFACAIIVALAFAAYAYVVSRRTDRTWMPIVAIGAICAVPQLYAWYAIWTIGAAALAIDNVFGVAAIAASVATVFRYIPDSAWPSTTFLMLAPIAQTVLPLLVAVAWNWTRSPEERTAEGLA